MIVTAVLKFMTAVAGWLVDLLPDIPDGTSWVPALPPLEPMAQVLRDIDAIIPVVGPITMAMGLLAFLAVFLIFAAIQWVWMMLPLT